MKRSGTSGTLDVLTKSPEKNRQSMVAFFRTKNKHKGRELVKNNFSPSPEKADTPARSPTVFQNSVYIDQLTSITPRRIDTMEDARKSQITSGPFYSKKTSLIEDDHNSLIHQKSQEYLKANTDIQNPDIEVIDQIQHMIGGRSGAARSKQVNKCIEDPWYHAMPKVKTR